MKTNGCGGEGDVEVHMEPNLINLSWNKQILLYQKISISPKCITAHLQAEATTDWITLLFHDPAMLQDEDWYFPLGAADIRPLNKGCVVSWWWKDSSVKLSQGHCLLVYQAFGQIMTSDMLPHFSGIWKRMCQISLLIFFFFLIF